MKCNKCKCEVTEDEVFCHNCGCKIEEEVKEEGQNVQADELQVQKKIMKKKAIRAIVIFTIGILIAIVIEFFYDMMPKDIDMNANELSKIIYEEDPKKYSGDNLFVHGHLLRSSEEDNIYMLYTDNVEDFIIFTYEKGLDETIGDGSEITIQGKLGDLQDSGAVVLVGEDYSVQKKVEPIYKTSDLSEFCKSADKYVNKKVELWGKIIKTNSGSAYITDSDTLATSVWLYGISSQELVKFKYGTWCIIQGTVSIDDNTISVNVENIFQNDETKSLDDLEQEVKIEGDPTVDDIFKSPNNYLNKVVTVKGLFPHSASYDHSGNLSIKILGETEGHYIVLKGRKINTGGCSASVTGTLTYDGNDYIMDVTDYTVLQMPTIGDN